MVAKTIMCIFLVFISLQAIQVVRDIMVVEVGNQVVVDQLQDSNEAYLIKEQYQRTSRIYDATQGLLSISIVAFWIWIFFMRKKRK